MAVWERYHGLHTLTAEGQSVQEQVFNNLQADENFEASDVVAVDGIMTLISDTDDLCGFRILVVSQQITVGNLTEDEPQPHSQEVYYSWFCGRGPMVFRLRSKRTVPPEHQMVVQGWKASGTTATALRWGLHVLWVVKH